MGLLPWLLMLWRVSVYEEEGALVCLYMIKSIFVYKYMREVLR